MRKKVKLRRGGVIEFEEERRVCADERDAFNPPAVALRASTGRREEVEEGKVGGGERKSGQGRDWRAGDEDKVARRRREEQ
eukprot:188727-Hanusia_phi.AAC.1